MNATEASRGPVTAREGCAAPSPEDGMRPEAGSGRPIAGTCVTEIGGNVTHSLHHMDGQQIVTACGIRAHFLGVVFAYIEPTCALCGEEMEAS